MQYSDVGLKQFVMYMYIINVYMAQTTELNGLHKIIVLY